MSNPYASPQAARPARRLSRLFAKDPQIKRYRRSNVVLCKTIGAIAFPVGTSISLMAVVLIQQGDESVPWWEIALFAATGAGLLAASVLSLSRKRAGAFAAAFISSLLLIYLGLAAIIAFVGQVAGLSTGEFLIVAAILAFPEALILLLAGCLACVAALIAIRQAAITESARVADFEQEA